jgi:hypothetical protein
MICRAALVEHHHVGVNRQPVALAVDLRGQTLSSNKI